MKAVTLVILAGTVMGQTRVDLKTQSQRVDFAAAGFTRPVATGTTLPAICSAGQLFFNTAAIPGSNLYACTATNIWTLEAGGSGGASFAGQLGEFRPTRASANTLTIGAGCSQPSPCIVRFGGFPLSFTGAASAVVSSGTGLLYVYFSNNGTLTVGHNFGVSCTALCVAVSGITAFPLDALPLATWSVTGGTLDVNGLTDFRAFISTKNITPGAGVSTAENNGATIVALDQAVVGLRVATPPNSSTACTSGSWATDGAFYYLCVASGSWKRTAISSW